MFRLNHLILGTTDIAKSQEFYVDLLGFRFLDSFIDTGTGNEGRILRYTSPEGSEHLELLPRSIHARATAESPAHRH